jgi:hypothetical protein
MDIVTATEQVQEMNSSVRNTTGTGIDTVATAQQVQDMDTVPATLQVQDKDTGPVTQHGQA